MKINKNKIFYSTIDIVVPVFPVVPATPAPPEPLPAPPAPPAPPVNVLVQSLLIIEYILNNVPQFPHPPHPHPPILYHPHPVHAAHFPPTHPIAETVPVKSQLNAEIQIKPPFPPPHPHHLPVAPLPPPHPHPPLPAIDL